MAVKARNCQAVERVKETHEEEIPTPETEKLFEAISKEKEEEINRGTGAERERSFERDLESEIVSRGGEKGEGREKEHLWHHMSQSAVSLPPHR